MQPWRRLISDSWLEAPRHKPHKCHRFLSGDPEHGPYFEEDFHYVDPRDPNLGAYGEGTTLRLYHSAAWIREMCSKPGSPFVLRTAAEEQAQRAARAEEEEAHAAALDRIEELEAEVASLRAKAASPIDEAALVNGIVGILDTRYARKAGRKPAGTAA